MTTIDLRPAASNGRGRQVVGHVAANAGPPRGGLPAAIPREQLYYWSSSWQRDEAENLAELQAGHGRTFESGLDAVRWLLNNDD